MKKWIPVFILSFFIANSVVAVPQSKEYTYSTYQEMRAEVGRLHQQQKYGEMARLLEWGFKTFPDHREANAFNLMFAYARLKQWTKGVGIMKKALDNGIWFGKYAFRNPLFEGYHKSKQFQKLLKKNDLLFTEAQRKSSPQLKIQKPDTVEKGKTYPLFIALHGGGENLEQFMPRWTSPRLRKEFFVAYLQSSQLISMNGFNWTEDMEISLKEIKEYYLRIISEYPIDTGQVVVGGFSSGGVAALEVVLKNPFPVRGFIVLCPAKPDRFSEAEVTAAKNRGIRGTLLTTEMDQRIDQQRQMAQSFQQQGLQYQFVVTPNIGHWYPDDLEVKIDRALEHIEYRLP